MTRTCLLCGDEEDVTMALVRYPDAYTTLPRCRDHQACRDRVESTGDTWEVEDGTLALTKTEATR